MLQAGYTVHKVAFADKSSAGTSEYEPSNIYCAASLLSQVLGFVIIMCSSTYVMTVSQSKFPGGHAVLPKTHGSSCLHSRLVKVAISSVFEDVHAYTNTYVHIRTSYIRISIRHFAVYLSLWSSAA